MAAIKKDPIVAISEFVKKEICFELPYEMSNQSVKICYINIMMDGI